MAQYMVSQSGKPLRGRKRSPLTLGLLLLVLIVVSCTSFKPVQTHDRQIIILWHTFTGTEAQALEALTDQFNAENPWQIVLVAEHQDNLLGKLKATTEGRPDLVTLWPRELSDYIALNAVGATPTASPEVRKAWNDLLPMAKALYEVNGLPQALPLGLAAYVAYFNADWLGDLGYDIQTANWEDFRRTACAATDPERGRVGLGVPARASTLLAFLAASGSQIVGKDGYYQFSDDAGQEAAAILKEVFSGKCGMIYEDWDAGVNQFSKSAVAMIVDTSEHRVEIARAVLNGRNFLLNIGNLPSANGPGPMLWYGPGLMVTATEDARREAALKVMFWLLSPDAQAYWGQNTTLMPVRRSVVMSMLEETGQGPIEDTSVQLWKLALKNADDGRWISWPQPTNRITCRASLLRGLLALQQQDTDPRAYLDTAVTACNTGVELK